MRFRRRATWVPMWFWELARRENFRGEKTSLNRQGNRGRMLYDLTSSGNNTLGVAGLNTMSCGLNGAIQTFGRF